MRVDAFPRHGGPGNDSLRYLWAGPSMAVHVGSCSALGDVETAAELGDSSFSDEIGKIDHVDYYNTARVGPQDMSYTNAGITPKTGFKHNSCMAKYTDTTIIRGMQAADARLRLKAAREARGWSQERLSQETGWEAGKAAEEQPRGALSPSRIGNYEQGTRLIGLEEAEIFSNLFEVPAPWFLGVVDRKEAEILAVGREQRGKIVEPKRIDRSVKSSDAAQRKKDGFKE